MPVVPPDPWKLAKILVALYDVFGSSSVALVPDAKDTLDSCAKDVEELRELLRQHEAGS